MNNFAYYGNNSNIIQAVKRANEIQDQIIKLLNAADVKKFVSSTIGSSALAHIIAKHSGVTCEVRTYYYWRSKVLGKFVPSQPGIIWLNSNGLSRRSISGLVCTKWHERIHFLDLLEKGLSFGHDGNTYHAWKEQTAPYFVDYLAEKIVAGIEDEPQDVRTDNTNIIIYVPIYKRFWNWIKFW